ncbi:type IV secretion protein Rhs [Salmonella enterica subsp. enterica serovar Leeuwarden]|nr:type IV secretion protein Rhs [Salmonella enterica subsp. enterica serovar Leeuwarden]
MWVLLFSWRTLRYLYYGSGHLQQINLGRDVISEFTRDHLHREVQRSQGRLDTRRMYDRTGRLTRKLTCKGMRGVVPETFIDREYAYSGQDELLKKRHSRQGVTDYFYDTTGRITACRNEAYLDSWQYDAAANLLDRRQGETAQAGAGSVVPFNRITSYRGLHYRYDEYGRVVEKRGRNGTQHYRWDAEHRLTEVAVIRGSTVRRYGFVYDAPEEMTDGGGNIVWEAGYQVWGNLTHEKETRPVQQNLRFQGQYLDRETGLHYNLYRFYDPDIGKFISGDPISLRGGINLYAYAPNPLSWIDPLGLTGEWVNPKDINFSQRTISPHDYAEIMRNGGWDWDRSPLRVIDIDGQLVSYDNRRLDAALEAGLDKVKIIRIDPNAPHPDSSTGKTWLQKFRERFRDRRNIKAGGIVPDKGLNSRPERTSRGCK